jgi:hypothetical protein
MRKADRRFFLKLAHMGNKYALRQAVGVMARQEQAMIFSLINF